MTAWVRRWQMSVTVPSSEPWITSDNSDVIRPMPRRQITLSIDALRATVPRAPRVDFEPGIILPIGRLCVWLWAIIRFYFGNLIDLVRRRDSLERRANRLRTVFENVGGSFLKLAQQLSLRADMLPYEYCVELGKML